MKKIIAVITTKIWAAKLITLQGQVDNYVAGYGTDFHLVSTIRTSVLKPLSTIRT